MRLSPASHRYAASIGSVAAALLITHHLDPLFSGATFFLLLAIVILSTWLGGLGPGKVALTLGSLGAWYFVLPPTFSFAVADPRRPSATLFCRSVDRRHADDG